MSDTPERIWIGELLWGDSPDPRKVEYVRADMHAAVTAERDQLRTILRAVKFCVDSTIIR